MNKTKPWSLGEVWNYTISSSDERVFEPRDYLYASELHGSMIDIYYKMKGVKPTNPPNERAFRKFFMGNMVEFIVQFILKTSGLYITSQDRGRFQYPGLVMVSGKLDFLAGGRVDKDAALFHITAMDLPPDLERLAKNAIDKFSKFGDHELTKMVLEIKSASDQSFGNINRTNQPLTNHLCQCFHYLKAFDLPVGVVAYINKDNAMMREFAIYNPSNDENIYKSWIEEYSSYYLENTAPPKESELIFDETNLSFKKNYKVEYSSYLSLLYGYESPEVFYNEFGKKATQYNRVLKRCAEGANMTKANLEVIAEAKKSFPDWDDIVDKAKLNLELLVEEEKI